MNGAGPLQSRKRPYQTSPSRQQRGKTYWPFTPSPPRLRFETESPEPRLPRAKSPEPPLPRAPSPRNTTSFTISYSEFITLPPNYERLLFPYEQADIEMEVENDSGDHSYQTIKITGSKKLVDSAADVFDKHLYDEHRRFCTKTDDTYVRRFFKTNASVRETLFGREHRQVAVLQKMYDACIEVAVSDNDENPPITVQVPLKNYLKMSTHFYKLLAGLENEVTEWFLMFPEDFENRHKDLCANVARHTSTDINIDGYDYDNMVMITVTGRPSNVTTAMTHFDTHIPFVVRVAVEYLEVSTEDKQKIDNIMKELNNRSGILVTECFRRNQSLSVYFTGILEVAQYTKHEFEHMMGIKTDAEFRPMTDRV